MLHLFQKRASEDKCHKLFTVLMSSCHPANSVKVLIGSCDQLVLAIVLAVNCTLLQVDVVISEGQEQNSSWYKYLLGEKLASPSIGNTLWRVWTVFTPSAITLPQVSRFGWNLEHSWVHYFPVRDRFFQKGKFFDKIANDFRRQNSLTIWTDENLRLNDPSTECPLSIVAIRIHSKSFPWPVQCAHEEHPVPKNTLLWRPCSPTETM